MGRPLRMGGNAWTYLTESVTPEVGEIPLGSDSARYYSAPGTPPGRFLGRGLDGLGRHPGAVKSGDPVSTEMLHNMLARLADPLTGVVLGRQPSLATKAPVAGFDLTFSPPKSVSVLWAMADRETKAMVEDLCHRALSEVLVWAEDHVFRTRTGAQGVRCEEIRGVVASSWMHYESRDGDPQLHHHVIVLNRAQTASDGRWRTLDSRGLHPWIVALSERHVGVIEDLMTERLGLGWQQMRTVGGRELKREVEGVAPGLVAEFSRRRAAIQQTRDQVVADFEAEHGRPPTESEWRRLDRVSWRHSRSAKVHRSLGEMTAEWNERARPWVGEHPQSWVASLAGRSDLPALRSDDLSDDMVADVARAALWARAESSATFGEANLFAAAERQLHGVRFASGERALVAERVVARALGMAVKITPPEHLHVPAAFRSPDGSSQFRPRSSWRYTTQELLDAEARLLDAGRDATGPRVGVATATDVSERPLPGRNHRLGLDQGLAVERVTTSGRVLDLLVGPAGTGKTTALVGVLAAWEAEHGRGSVVGLAPSASAAMNLATELGIACDNTAKWITELERNIERRAEIRSLRRRLDGLSRAATRRAVSDQIAALEAEVAKWGLRRNQLLVVDEAGMAGTLALDRLVAEARQVGGKVLLVGDWAQLSAVDAGGAFGMLVEDRGGAPELSEVRRFRESWERRASVELRLGSAAGVDAYLAHERVRHGEREEMLDALYRAWKADTGAGRVSLMIAQDAATVVELNRRAQRDRQAADQVGENGIALADGLEAGVGDLVVTRRNDRRLCLVDGQWVRNRDRWVVTATGEDGAVTVRRAGGTEEVVLPAGYVADHVELGYASTAYGAQGMTADTAHALVTTAMTGEVLYVAATRGRDGNRLYVDVCPQPAQPEMAHGPGEPLDVRDVLVGVAGRRGAESSVHQTLRNEWTSAWSLERLAREHQTLAAAATAQRWERVMETCGLNDEVLVKARDSVHWPGLLGALQDADNRGLKPEGALAALAADRPIEPERDPAAALRARLLGWERNVGGRWRARSSMVAGLVPRAHGIADPDMARAIRECEQLIARRARELAEAALAGDAAWARPLGPPPDDPAARAAFVEHVAVVAAYRDRWDIGPDSVLGDVGSVSPNQQRAHRNRARRAGEEARRMTGVAPEWTTRSEPTPPRELDVRLRP